MPTSASANGAAPEATFANLTLAVTAPASVNSAGQFSYTINLGNSGTADTPASFTAHVSDVLPLGMVATAAFGNTGVTSVNCTRLNSAGATLSCSVNVNIALVAGAANGAASFIIAATAPTAGGSITNYVSVDPLPNSNSPPTPGPNCSPLTSCGSAQTTVLSAPNLTLSKTAQLFIVNGDSNGVQYTINLGNSGQTSTPNSFTAHVIDTLPQGMGATAVFPNTNNTSVNCGSFPSAPGATLSCTVSINGALVGGAANGAASFFIRNVSMR